MKKIFLVILLIISLTACGNKVDDEIINDSNNEEVIVNSVIGETSEKEIIEEVLDNKEIEKVEETKENIIKKDEEKDIETVEYAEDTTAPEVEPIIEEKIYEEGIEVGKKAIDFEVELLSGEKVKLSSYLGKPVFLNFWATWCGPCVREMPAIENIKNEYDGKLEVLLINGGEPRDDVESFIDKKGYTFDVGLDKKGDILTSYDSMYIPLSIFIDENGIIKERKVGALSYESMNEIVKSLINME